MRFTQFLDQTSGESILRQSSLELALALQFLPVLGSHVGSEKSFARVVLLRTKLAEY
jgi:hypothetical protein